MNESGGKHDSRQLSPHEEVHLIQGPGKKWAIGSIDLTWVQGKYAWPDGVPLPVPEGFNWTKVYAQQLGWENREFDTPDQAYTYVEEQLRACHVPWRIEVTVECDWRGRPA
ncbi:MAG: hypothetical protein QGG71_22160 [Pirellulaceae bacterium]|jgi:hypothetical protein|nr:hypothetical protein [Pirellulaceae bacterium]